VCPRASPAWVMPIVLPRRAAPWLVSTIRSVCLPVRVRIRVIVPSASRARVAPASIADSIAALEEVEPAPLDISAIASTDLVMPTADAWIGRVTILEPVAFRWAAPTSMGLVVATASPLGSAPITWTAPPAVGFNRGPLRPRAVTLVPAKVVLIVRRVSNASTSGAISGRNAFQRPDRVPLQVLAPPMRYALQLRVVRLRYARERSRHEKIS
jgi:hypothetical protein